MEATAKIIVIFIIIKESAFLSGNSLVGKCGCKIRTHGRIWNSQVSSVLKRNFTLAPKSVRVSVK